MNARLIPLLLMIAAISGLYFFTGQRNNNTLSDEPLILHQQPPQIVMFSTQSCGYCKLARQFFAKHHLPYVEHDIETSDEQRRMFDLLGGSGTPLLIINKQLIHGFDEQQVRDAL